MSDKLGFVRAPHFCAGYTLNGRHKHGWAVVDTAAPILSYMIGWSYEEIDAYCKKKGWECFEPEEQKENKNCMS